MMAAFVKFAYPVKNRCPSFHTDTLENCQHSQADVVERGDAVVGPVPLFQADGDVGVAGVAAHGGGLLRAWETGTPLIPIYHDLV